MPLDNLLADREAHSGAGILLPGVKTLKQNEDALEVFRVDANAIIPYVKNPVTIFPVGANMNFGPSLAAELNGVTDKVLKKLAQLDAISLHRRQRIVFYDCAAFPDRHFQVGNGIVRDFVRVCVFKRTAAIT